MSHLPVHTHGIKPLVLAVATACLTFERSAHAQVFDPASAPVLQAYAQPLDNAKVDAARAGLNMLLPSVASFPSLLTNPPSTGASSNFFQFSGSVGSFTFNNNPTLSSLHPVYDAGTDADLAALGNPVLLDDIQLRATASFNTSRNFLIGPNKATIDTQGFDLAISGNITVQGSLTKLGFGVLTLGGNGTWSAPLVIVQGTVRGSTASLQTAIETAGTVEFVQATNGAHGFAITGTGSLRKSGVGPLLLSGDNSYGGNTQIDEGSIALQGAGKLGGGAVVVGSGATLDLTQVNGARTIGGLSGSGSILLGNHRLDINASQSSTFSGSISGMGSLGKGGTGLLALSSANSYSGGTVVANGTLALTGAGSLNGSGRVTVNAGANFDIAQASGTRSIGSLDGSGFVSVGTNGLTIGGDATSADFGGTISGSGTLTKTGSGTLSLFGSTQHTGTTVVSQGTVVARAASLGPTIVNNARLIFQESRTETSPNAAPVPPGTLHASYPELYVYSGDITGTGEVVKRGSGALWLRGTNNYSGGTTIDDGVLVGNDLSLRGTIVNNAGVAFYQSADGTYAGSMSGSGLLLKYGPGNLALTGINSHTGGTGFSGLLSIADDRSLGAANAAVIIAGGTLRTTSNVATSRRFGLSADGATFDTQSNTVSVGGVISGPGALTKLGTGRLILSAANTYTGGTTVHAGTLQVDGSLASGVYIATGASLAGSGSIHGNLTLAPGSSLRTRADSSGILDRIQVTSAQINEAMLVVEAGANPPGRSSRPILTASNAISGQFAQVTTNLALLTPTLTYDDKNVFLTLRRNDLQYQSLAQSEAQFGIASSLDRLVQAGNADAVTVAASIDPLSAPGARAAYDSIAGVGHIRLAAIQQSGFRALTQQAGARLGLAEMRREGTPRPGLDAIKLAFDDQTISDASSVYAAASHGPSSEPAATRDHGFWLRGYGGHGRIDGAAGSSGAELAFSGVLAGYDGAISDDLRMGLLIAYAKPKLTQADPGNRTTADTRQLALYSRYRQGPLRIDLLANLAGSDVNTRRSIVAGGLVRTAASAYDGQSTGINLEAAYSVDTGSSLVIEPLAGISWVRQRYDAYTETGAGIFNLTEPARRAYSLRSTLGVRALTTGQWRGMDVHGELRTGWSHEFRSQPDAIVRLSADTNGASFTVPATDMPRNSVSIGGGLSLNATRAIAFYADFNSERSSRQHTNTLSAGLRYRW